MSTLRCMDLVKHCLVMDLLSGIQEIGTSWVNNLTCMYSLTYKQKKHITIYNKSIPLLKQMICSLRLDFLNCRVRNKSLSACPGELRYIYVQASKADVEDIALFRCVLCKL